MPLTMLTSNLITSLTNEISLAKILFLAILEVALHLVVDLVSQTKT